MIYLRQKNKKLLCQSFSDDGDTYDYDGGWIFFVKSGDKTDFSRKSDTVLKTVRCCFVFHCDFDTKGRKGRENDKKFH
ncbi:MAG: hypothetical protein ACLRZ7_04380 [Lachnospiraceae bacterium]